MNRSRLWIVATASLALFFLGCDDDEDCHGAPAFLSFSISDPTPVQGDTVTLSWRLENFELSGHEGEHEAEHEGEDEGEHGGDEPMSATEGDFKADDDDDGDDDDDECLNGHVHIYMDDLMSNPLAMPNTSSIELEISTDDSLLGPHTLFARLQHGDHRIVVPEVVSRIEISILPD